MNSGEKVFFFTLMDHKSGTDKIVFGLPRSLNSAVVAFHLLIKPSLKKMMGALATVTKNNVQLGESFCLDRYTGGFHHVYSDDTKKGNIFTNRSRTSQNKKAYSDNMKRNLLPKSLSVGIISLGDSAKKNLSAITPMINHILPREVIWTFENQRKNSPQLLSTLMDWTVGNRVKNFIF